MARLTPEKNATRPVAITGGADAEADATPRVTRAPARNGSDRCVVKNRRRLHRRALHPCRIARGNSLRSRAPTRVTLRARTNLEGRNSAETQTTLRRQNHPRHPLPRRVVSDLVTPEASSL